MLKKPFSPTRKGDRPEDVHMTDTLMCAVQGVLLYINPAFFFQYSSFGNKVRLVGLFY